MHREKCQGRKLEDKKVEEERYAERHIKDEKWRTKGGKGKMRREKCRTKGRGQKVDEGRYAGRNIKDEKWRTKGRGRKVESYISQIYSVPRQKYGAGLRLNWKALQPVGRKGRT